MSEPLYDGEEREKWVNGLSEMDGHNTRHLLVLFGLLGIPKSFLDVGCGTGAMVKTAISLGVDAHGVDQLVEESWGPHFTHVNLVDYFKIPQKVEMVTCFEVAEHIHESAHSTLCDAICDNLMDGPEHYLIFSAARPGQDGTGHVACVVEGTEVSTLAPRMASRRFYDGETVTIVTRGGNNLTITPNHPILTEFGWVKAGLLKEGNHLFGGSFADRKPFDVMPNDYNRPSRVEEIFSSLLKMYHSLRSSVPLTAKDFHGDGIANSNVDIVFPNSFSKNRIDSPILKPFENKSIEKRYSTSSNLHRLRSLFKTINGMPLSDPRDMSIFGKRTPFFDSQVAHSDLSALGCTSNPDTVPFEFPGNAGIRNSKLLRYLDGGLSRLIESYNVNGMTSENSLRVTDVSNLDSHLDKSAPGGSKIDMSLFGKISERLAGNVSLDEIIEIKRSNFCGHVYNLQTDDGWYIANGIITHNCRPASYWHDQFIRRGLSYDALTTMNLALLWSNMRSPLSYFWDNVIVFRR